MKLREIKQLYLETLLELYSKEEINNIFFLVSNHFLKLDKIKLIFFKNHSIEDVLVKKFKITLNKLSKGCPIQYILGETIFYDCKIKVNHNVLIPRPETEELTAWALKYISKKMNVLDICTGSGCIAIAIASNAKCKVSAFDISTEALDIAKKNSIKNKVKVDFQKENILKNINKKMKKFDVIISNPPYVLQKHKYLLHKNVLSFEPHLALFINNENPLLFYEKIITFSKKYLKNKGLLFFEINELFGQEILNLLDKEGFGKNVLRKDINGKKRMIKAERK